MFIYMVRRLYRRSQTSHDKDVSDVVSHILTTSSAESSCCKYQTLTEKKQIIIFVFMNKTSLKAYPSLWPYVRRCHSVSNLETGIKKPTV